VSDNTALVTDASATATQKTLDDYSAGVMAHIAGDWGGHNQIKAYSGFFLEPVTGHQVSTSYLRLCLRHGSTDRVVSIPAFLISTAPTSGSTPIIISQPLGQAVTAGAIVTFRVAVGSLTAVTYQWRKNGLDLTGQTTATLVIPKIETGDQGLYSVAVSNANGATVSAAAALTVAYA